MDLGLFRACACLMLLIGTCRPAYAGGQITNVSTIPVPEWVRLCSLTVPTNAAAADKSESSRCLLFERQFCPKRKETFTRLVRLMGNQSAVQEFGTVTFSFDPSFQELLLHCVKIHRHGTELQRLDPSKLKIIQPEPELESHLLTGEHRIVLFVSDLRVGDVLEYAYTVRGENQVLGGHFSTRFVIQAGRPVDRERLRVVWSPEKPLFMRRCPPGQAPSEEACDDGVGYLWDFANLEPIPFEGDLPASYEPFPYVEFSDFESWSSVVDWALRLYDVGTPVWPQDAADLLTNWQAGATSQEERARMALNFVQDEIRYTGVEIGPDSLCPARAPETFQSRYGDCKAKALLLCSMLHEFQIEAYPALVNTSARENLAEGLPSALVFDHVIVKVVLAGKNYWIDPTRSHQGGGLRDRYLPPLRKALVLKKGVAALEDVPVCSNVAQRVTSTFRLENYDSPVPFTVKTVYSGLEADTIRAYLAETQPKERANGYLNFYARYYPTIKAARPVKINDERAANVVTVTEFYEITNLWELDKSNGRLEATFYADSLERMLTEPDTRLRTMPLAIRWPARREHEIIVYLPDSDWGITPVNQTVQDPAFTFHHRRSFSASRVRFDYYCETKASAVAADRVPAYLKNRQEMDDSLAEVLYRPDDHPGAVLRRINWLMVVVTGFGGAASAAGSIWLWRKARPPITAASGPPPLPVDSRYRGLRGWLVLLGFGLCAQLIWRPVSVARHWQGFFSLTVWQTVAVPGGEQYHPLFGPLLTFETLCNVLLIALNILALAMFFTKRRMFPRILIALLLANLIYVLADEVGSSFIPFLADSTHPTYPQGVLRVALQAVVWGYYTFKSRRVKATFVR